MMIEIDSMPAPSRLAVIRRVAVLSLLASLFFLGMLWLFEQFSYPQFIQRLSWFHVDEVKISAEWPLQSEQVRAWLPQLEGKSILSVKGDAIIRDLSIKPWVDWVTVKKEFPNRVHLEIGTKRALAIEMVKGRPHFVDAHGTRITRATPALMAALDLPVITRASESEWKLSDVMNVIERFQKGLNSQYTISQVVLGSYPFFKIFLAKPRLEVSFSMENWDTQLPILALLLHSPPRQISKKPRSINLILSKKAVVSSSL